MADIFKFPRGGYDVKVLRKEDVVSTIDANIVDKDIALAIVRRCEIDAANFLREGRWAGIPFIGNIRIPQTVQRYMSEESQEILKEAQETLEADKYILFRKRYANEIGKQVKVERYYKYIVSKFVGKNPRYFKIVSEKNGDKFARFSCYTLSELTIVSSNEQR